MTISRNSPSSSAAPTCVSPSAMKKSDRFVRIPDHRVNPAERRPRRGHVTRLLRELALRGGELGFARIELAGREFQEHRADRIAELALDDEAAVRQHGDDQYGPGMHDVFARREAAVGQADGIAADVQQLSVEHRFGRHFRFRQVRIVRRASSARSLKASPSRPGSPHRAALRASPAPASSRSAISRPGAATSGSPRCGRSTAVRTASRGPRPG